MGLDRKKLQKKKARKAAKAKKKKAQRTTGGPMSVHGAYNAPIHECWEPRELFNRDRGIGTVIITCRTQQRDVLMAAFLVDVFCLGVKNAFIKSMPEPEYKEYLQQLQMQEPLKAVSAACARKLVEEAEAYAQELGFKPHKDYRKAQKIFGDIDPAECSRSFEFGLDGKPLYIAGPYDKPRFRNRVLKTLTENLEPGEFDFLTPLDDDRDDFFE
jgi:hypothetical protein